MLALAGCSTGDDAVAQGGTFEFVAPGGKTDIFYDPPENRGRPGKLAGPELMPPAGGMVLGTAPKNGKQAALESLFVNVNSQRVDITDRNVVVASVSRARVIAPECQRI